MPKDKQSVDDSVGATGTSTSSGSRKKRKHKFTKINVEFGQEVSTSDLALKSIPSKPTTIEKVWWEAWKDGESARSLFLDEDMMPFQRVSEAAVAFNKDRAWPTMESQVRNRWDQFQVYVGLLENASGDDFSRLSTFVQDPSRVIQVYLSSYFIEKGLHFSQYNCDIIPKLLHFYTNFLLVNDVLPGKETDLRHALSIIETARIELALFHSIGQVCPDHFNLTLKEILSTKNSVATVQIIDHSLSAKADVSEKNQNSAGHEPDSTAEVSSVPLQGETGSSATSEWPGGLVISQPISAWGADPVAGWGSADDEGADTSGWGAAVTRKRSASPLEDNPWGTLDTSPPASSFVSSHIKNSLPKTHVLGLVEHSVRRVKLMIPPTQRTEEVECEQGDDPLAVALEDELCHIYWTAVLEPWPIEEAEESASIPSVSRANVTTHATEDRAIVDEGVVSDLYVGKVASHDCLSDDIAIFLEEDTAKALRVGMGLGGTWAQLLRALDRTEDVQKESSDEHRYWFMLELLRILPSYYVV
ncbi:hypothetical protein F5878DRAFT_603675 [Lentinula raphanica]|uniref:Uncharacterized protein n=1 Tax=Lentinula raphanica TaxID=153919 RepID=A0AA38PJ12_9AGAR|nr:hypothetical protein F5878DRAFT_603675 [Lentinula raphanica]